MRIRLDVGLHHRINEVRVDCGLYWRLIQRQYQVNQNEGKVMRRGRKLAWGVTLSVLCVLGFQNCSGFKAASSGTVAMSLTDSPKFRQFPT